MLGHGAEVVRGLKQGLGRGAGCVLPPLDVASMDNVCGPREHVRRNPRRSTNEDGVEHGRPVAADERPEDQPDNKAEGRSAPYR